MDDPRDDLDRFSPEHRARRAAGGPPRATPPPATRIVRDLVLMGLLLVIALALVPFSDVANDAYPEPRGYADRIQSVFERVSREGAPLLETTEAAGLALFSPASAPPGVVVVTHPEPTEQGWCYGLRLGVGVVTAAVRFPPAEGGCVRSGTAAFSSTGSWDRVLPSERITTVWFVPAMVILVALVVAVTTDLVLQILARRSR